MLVERGARDDELFRCWKNALRRDLLPECLCPRSGTETSADTAIRATDAHGAPRHFKTAEQLQRREYMTMDLQDTRVRVSKRTWAPDELTEYFGLLRQHTFVTSVGSERGQKKKNEKKKKRRVS